MNKAAKAEFKARYAENWHQISKRARRLTGGKCILCRKGATSVHHAVYRTKEGKSIAGQEIPGVHVFPLCDRCHKIAHSPQNWEWDRRSPALGNRNTPKFYLELRNGWLGAIAR